MGKTDYELGRTDGYCCIEPRYPNNANYMRGHAAGFRQAESEYYSSEPDYCPVGRGEIIESTTYCC